MDYAFLDITIPGGMGAKDIINILKLNYSHIKVIITSGYSDDVNHDTF